MQDRLSRGIAAVLLWMGVLISVVAGLAIATISIVYPRAPFLGTIIYASIVLVCGFGAAALFLLILKVTSWPTSRQIEIPVPIPAPPEPPPVAAVEAAPAPAPAPAPPIDSAAAAALFRQMKTYVDLEMWDLALEKANAILKDHGGTAEADAVKKTIYELNWKAEPKYMEKSAAVKGLTPAQQRLQREKGVAAMLHHLRTYIDLEMWDLAREKATHIMKEYADAPQAAEAAKLLQQIGDRHSQPTVPESAPSQN